jgi:hypothetical protein
MVLKLFIWVFVQCMTMKNVWVPSWCCQPRKVASSLKRMSLPSSPKWEALLSTEASGGVAWPQRWAWGLKRVRIRKINWTEVVPWTRPYKLPCIYFSVADLDERLVPERLLPSLEQRVHKELNKAEKYVTTKQGTVNKGLIEVLKLAIFLL